MEMTPPAESLTEQFRRTFLCYDESLLRQVAQKLCRPRNQWPASELIDRIQAALANPVVVDRRLKELPAACRQALALIAHSRQPSWKVGSLVEMLIALGHSDGLAPILDVLQRGLLVPEMPPWTPATDSPPVRLRLKSFETWLGRSQPTPQRVIASPLATARALGEDLGLPECPGESPMTDGRGSAPQEADGLEWPIRLVVLQQQVALGPLRRTQQRDFFKRDLERLRGDTLLAATPDAPATILDIGLFTVGLALAVGLLHEEDAELAARETSMAWRGPLAGLLLELWAGLPNVEGWSPETGWRADANAAGPYASAQLLTLMLLSRLREGSWARVTAIEAWLHEHHPYWKGGKAKPAGITAFLLGVAYLLRMVQVRSSPGGAAFVRLSDMGRWLLGLASNPPPAVSYPQTLLIQPNLEVLVYRQGLTPGLLVALSRFATWKGIGPACTLQLEPQSVYRGLEAGESFATIVETLERHSMKALPMAVLDSLRTWSLKRERITVFPSAALFEFQSAADLAEAISRGLPAQRLTDRLAVVAGEDAIDYRHFRLTGTRDYCLPPEPCVEVDPDGVTLGVDLVRSDLLLEIEVERFAELSPRPAAIGRRFYRLTPSSLAAARQQGVTAAFLGRWFEQRAGTPITPAARLLLAGPEMPPPELRRQIVLHVADPGIADGLLQWPPTRSLIQARLGPTALAVAEENITALSERLREIGVLMPDPANRAP